MPELGHRAATAADIDMVHEALVAVIDESQHYNDLFKAHEKARMTKGFLRSLIAIDPNHVLILTVDGKPGGGLVSGPDLGSIFRYWSWIFPDYRQTRLGLHGMRLFDQVWDNNRFHKAYTFVRTENEVALALLRRYGYEQSGLLKQHIFGQDYVVMERAYTKAVDGYDTGMSSGRLGKALATISGMLGGR